jgi:RNA polymerase sigma factor (sigma-70 family)
MVSGASERPRVQSRALTSDSTRWTVIQRAAAGSAPDRDAFAQRYGPVIGAYLGARWRGTPLFDEVDDVRQQVFVQCFKEGGALGNADAGRETGFRAYLYGVVRNVALTMERGRARSKEYQSDSGLNLEALDSKEDSLARVFDRTWAQALMRDAAALQLKRAQAVGKDAVRRHRLLALRFGEGLPIRDIAKRWDVEAALLHREYAKAREEFRRALTDLVGDLEGSAESVAGELSRLRAYLA